MGLIVGVALVLAIIAAVLMASPRRPRGTQALRAKYLSLIQMPPAAAQKTLERVLSEMKRQYPNRTTRWHLQRMISDLQRDRR